MLQVLNRTKPSFCLILKPCIAEMEEIPDDLIINWDHTGLNYVPVSKWTMAKEGSKRVESMISVRLRLCLGVH